MRRAAVSSLALLLVMSAVHDSSAARRKTRSTGAQRIGLVPLSSNGTGAPQVAAGVQRAIITGLRKQKHHVVVLDEGRAARLRLCLQQPSCGRSLGTRYGLAVLITGHVEQQGSGFQLDLRAVSGKSGEVVAVEDRQLRSAKDERVGLRLAQNLLARARSAASSVSTARRSGDTARRREAEAAAASADRGDTEDPLAAVKPQPAASQPGVTADAERPAVRAAPKSFGQRYWPSLTCGAAGLVAMGVGIAFGAISKQAVDQGRETTSQIEAYQLRDKAQKNALVANVLFGVGGAALAASAVLLIFELKGAMAERRDAEQAPRRAFRLQFGMAPGGAGLFARGEF